jgi:heme-degrading monooxygenase HmoA
MNNDEMVVKTVWKSAHAVRDWPGMVTIRRFSPFKNEKIEGDGDGYGYGDGDGDGSGYGSG